MFRIHFDYKIGRFIIQVKICYLIWKTVNTSTPVCEIVATVHSFDTYDKAIKHAVDIGLTKLYRDCSANMFNLHMSGSESVNWAKRRIGDGENGN